MVKMIRMIMTPKPIHTLIAIGVVCFMPFSGSLFANNNQATILTKDECGSCHTGGAPQLTQAAGGFALIDPATNTGVTREYEPNKTYKIVIGFNGQNVGGNYRNAYVLK